MRSIGAVARWTIVRPKPLAELDGVVNEGRGELEGENLGLGLHFGFLRVNLNNVHVSRIKMNIVQENLREIGKNLGAGRS